MISEFVEFDSMEEGERKTANCYIATVACATDN